MENYNEKMLKTIENFTKDTNRAPQILLHCCCGVCAAASLLRLYDKCDIICYYYNPNILDETEYLRRLSALKTLIERFNADYGSKITLLCGEYDRQGYLDATKGKETLKEGDIRCVDCFNLRLSSTAQKCKQLGCDYYTTTLTLSPHKNAQLLNIIGKNCALSVGVEYLPSDFKKGGGVLASAQLCEKYGLYRQNYCGCGLGVE